MTRRRVGILGGSFDPVHVGHLVAAVGAKHDLDLDEVQLVVANDPWQKSAARTLAPAELRFAAVEAAVSDHAGLVASRLEIDRGGPSYTADTVAELADADTNLFLIVGFDAAAGLASWERWAEVASAVELVVVNRPGGLMPVLDPDWTVHEVLIPNIELSSTDLRDRLRAGRPLDYLIPDKSLEVLRANRTYS